MKRKYLFLGIVAVLLAAGGWWFARTNSRTEAVRQSSEEVSVESPSGGAESEPGQMIKPPGPHAPPDPIRKFRDLTPEQRVKLARQGPIGG